MDQELEAAIDRAGRDAVFARARALGWGANSPPPKYVWYGIISEITSGAKLSTPLTPEGERTPLHSQVLGFRLW